jgi:hypothetical protein
MFNGWILTMVISFVIKQVSHFGGATDWVKVKADFDARIKSIVHLGFFSDELSNLANLMIDGVAAALQDTADMSTIVGLAAAQNWSGALAALKSMVLAQWQPTSPEGQAVIAELQKLSIPS